MSKLADCLKLSKLSKASQRELLVAHHQAVMAGDKSQAAAEQLVVGAIRQTEAVIETIREQLPAAVAAVQPLKVDAAPALPPAPAASAAETQTSREADDFLTRLRSDMGRLKSQPRLTPENQSRYAQEVAPLEERAAALREKVARAKQAFQSTAAEAEMADIAGQMNAVYERLLAEQQAEGKPAEAAAVEKPRAPIRTAGDFRERAIAAGWAADVVDGTLALVAARAKVRGETVDQWLERNVADVQKGGVVPAGALRQDQTETPEFRRWFGKSKVVDANGEPLVVYHGTRANKPFTVFQRGNAKQYIADQEFDVDREGFFFASDKTVAARYGRGKEPMAVYLSVRKPLDLTDPGPEEAAILERAGFKGAAWTSAEQMWEAFDTPGVVDKLQRRGYDGVKMLEDEGDSVTWAVFSPTQIKSATGNRGTFDPENPNILMQGEPDLVALHNLSAENLLHAAKMGGLAAPSLAVTKKGHEFESYGDVTLIGDKELIRPGRGTKVFGADVYSPRYPDVRVKMEKADAAKLEAFFAETLKLYPNAKGRLTIDPARYDVKLVQDEAENREFERALEGPLSSRLAYLEEVGKAKPEWRTLSRDDLEQKVRGEVWSNPEGQPTFSEWVRRLPARLGLEGKERIFKGRNYLGNPIYIAHTIENVVRMLKKNIRAGEGFNYGAGNIRALVTAQFRTLSAVQAARDTIVRKAEFEKLKKEIDTELVAVATEAQPYMKYKQGFGDLDAFTEHLAEIVETRRAEKVWSDYYAGLPQEVKDRAYGFLNKLRSLPTEYFEAKPLRAVGLNEFVHAVIPKTASQGVKDALATRGIAITEYDPAVQGDRAAKVAQAAEQAGLLFQRNKGAVSFNDGRAVIHALESADVSTLVHETGHIFRRDLTPGELAEAERVYKVENGKWTRDAEERFARGFERYMQSGRAPIGVLGKVFKKFKEWLTAVYGALRGRLKAEERAFWDGFFGKQAEAAPAAAPIAPAPERAVQQASGRPARAFSEENDDSLWSTVRMSQDEDRQVAALEELHKRAVAASSEKDTEETVDQLNEWIFKGDRLKRIAADTQHPERLERILERNKRFQRIMDRWATEPAPRPARIEEAKREVEAAMDAAGVPKDSEEAESLAETGYFKGDRIAYTGNLTDDGFREFVYLEGAKKGQTGVRMTDAEREANAERAKAERDEMQEGFRRLRATETTKPVSERSRFVSTREMMHIRKGFHRGSQQEAIEAAAKSSAESNAPRYVYATAAGAQVANEVPTLPSGQAYLEVTATPTKGGHNVTIERREGGQPLTTAPESATVEKEEPSGPEAAPQDRLEPAAQDAGGDGPAGAGTAGKDATVHFSGLPDLPTRYAVVEAEALIPSHVPDVGPFKKRDDYVITNPRDYSDLNLAAKVHEHAAAKQADWFLAESPDSTNGPPIVTADGTVLSGNGRAMTLQLTAKRGKYDWYKDALVAKAPAVGIDAETVRGMKHPVLVRMATEALTADEMEKYASSGNVGATYEMSSVRENAQLGDLIDDSLLESVRLGLKENSNQSVGQILAGADGLRFRRELKRRLSQDFPQKLARFFEGDGDTLSDAGKVQTRDLLFTKVFTPETIEHMSPDWKDKLEGSIPQLLKFNRDFPEKTPVPQIAEAVEFRRGWKQSGQTLRDYLDQSFMFGETPPQISPAARMMLEFFDENGIRKVRAGLTDFLRELSAGAGLFAAQETRTTGAIAAETLGVESRKGADFGLGANNTFFTKQKIEDIRKQRKKRGPTMGSVLGGIDPLLLKQAFYEGGYWVEAGLREFKAWLSTMRQKYGGLGLNDDHLKQLWHDLSGFRRRVGLWERQVAGAERRATVKGEQAARRAAVELGRAGVRTIEQTQARGEAERVRDVEELGRAGVSAIEAERAKGEQAVERTAAAGEQQRVADVVSIGKAAARQMQREGRQAERKATAEIKGTAKFVARQAVLLKRASDQEIAEFAKERLGRQDADRVAALLPRLVKSPATLEARAKLIDRINRVAEQRRVMRAVRAVKTALRGLRRDLTPETRAALGDIAGTFSLTEHKAATLRAAEALLAAAEAAQVRGPIMDILPERVARARKLLAGAGKPLLRDMAAEDIEEIASTLRLLAEANSQQVAEHMERLAAAALADKAGSIEDLKRTHDKERLKIPVGARGELPHMGAARKFVSMLARMGLPAHLQWIFGTESRTARELLNDLTAAQERGQGIVQRANEAIQAELEAQGWDIAERRRRSEALDSRGWLMRQVGPFRTRQTQTVTVGLPAATAVETEGAEPRRLEQLELTSAERISLLGMFRDPRVQGYILKGAGLRFEGRRLAGVVYLTADDMRAIWEGAPADEHALAERMMGLYAELGRLIEQTNLERQGTTAEMNPLNWSIRRAREEFETDPNEALKAWAADNLMPKHAGTLKARTGGPVSIVVEDAFSGFAHHTAQIAAYVAKEQAMERIIRVLDNQQLRQQVANRVRFGLQGMGLIRETVQRFSGYSRADKYAAETMLSTLLRGVHVSSLAYKPHVIVGQAVSANKLQLVFEAGDLAAGMARSLADGGRHARALVDAGYSPMLLSRVRGEGFDLLTAGTRTKAVGAQFGDPGGALSRWGASLLQGSDNRVTYAAVEAGFREGQRQGLSGDDLDAYAVQRAARAIRDTQATADVLTISPLMQESRERVWMKFLPGMMFNTERNKTFNLLAQEALRYRDSGHTVADKARFGRAIGVVIADGVMYRGVKFLTSRGILYLAGLAALALTGRRPSDEEERKRRLAKQFVRGIGQDVLGLYPVVGDVAGDVLDSAVRIAMKEPGTIKATENPLSMAMEDAGRGLTDLVRALTAEEGETFQSGPDEGRSKRGVLARRGALQLGEATAAVAGIPWPAARQLGRPVVQAVESARPMGQFNRVAQDARQKLRELQKARDAEILRDRPDIEPEELAKLRKDMPVDLGAEARARTLRAVEDVIDRLNRAARREPQSAAMLARYADGAALIGAGLPLAGERNPFAADAPELVKRAVGRVAAAKAEQLTAALPTGVVPGETRAHLEARRASRTRKAEIARDFFVTTGLTLEQAIEAIRLQPLAEGETRADRVAGLMRFRAAWRREMGPLAAAM